MHKVLTVVGARPQLVKAAGAAVLSGSLRLERNHGPYGLTL